MNIQPSVERLTENIFSDITTMIRKFPYWIFALIAVLFVAIVGLSYTPIGWVTSKPVQEIIAPIIIGIAAACSLFVHWKLREKFSLILLVFVVSLFSRELHFYGTNNGFYIAFIFIVLWSWWERRELAQWYGFRCIRTLVPLCISIYLVTKILDRGYFSFLPEFSLWRHNAEETMETIGHLAILLLLFYTYKAGIRISSEQK
ncbi:MAG: hypothetical protein COA52_13240 [Hyphomicrobiales bacterium]|nr:hypothetical protein [Hyphomicrobiales bacterium]PCJ88459.1 MAG: hypothetical protein COA52_13240 [Hyphomicrobiales bacterium]